MRKLLLGSALLAAGFGPSSLLAQTPRAMNIDDAMNMVAVGDASMSPDGAWVLFSKRTLNWEENKYETEYHRVDLSGGPSFQYISEEGGSAFEFSPDGRYLAFRRKAGEGDKAKQQVFWLRTAGGEATQLTEHASDVAQFKWSADGSQLFFTAAEAKPDSVEKEIKNGDDAIFVDEGPNGQSRADWSNFWVLDVSAGEERRLTEGEQILSAWDVAPDGSRIVFLARESNRRNDGYLNEIHVLDVASGNVNKLTENSAPESSPQWSPDGSMVLFSAADNQEWMNRNTKLWLMDPDNGEQRLLTQGFEGTVSGPVWTQDGEAVLFNGQQGSNTNLFRVAVDSGEIEQLTDVTGTLRASSFSADRKQFVYSFSDFDTPPDLFAGSVGADGAHIADGYAESPVVKQLTEANPQVSDLQLASMELVRWRSAGDVEIEGLLHVPANRADGERVPLMLNIHGGPAGVFSNSWQPRYHIYAGLGYASLSPNVRGSSGYTDQLREGNTVQKGDGIGKGDYQDVMTGVDHVIEMGVADPDLLAVRGWSYGGILGGWTITQTDRFKAASIGAGVYDWTSEYGPGFNHDVRLWHIGGTPWENPEGWREQSALTHVANVTTPTLLLHGTEDPTDTEQQSMMFFVALKDVGKADVRYIKFPREPHGFREPRHQRVRDVEEIRWMQKYVLGEDWTPWERPAKEPKTADKVSQP